MIRIRNSEYYFFVLISVVSAFVIFLFSFTFEIFQNGDNCGYISLGMAFAGGRGFIDPALPGSFHFLWWPPGFPLFIAFFYTIFGPAWSALKLLIFIFLYAALTLFANIIYKNDQNRMKAALILTALCFSSGIHLLSSYLYSETFFIACSLLFFFVWHAWKEDYRWWKIVLLSIMAVYISSVRIVGICLPAALAVYLLFYAQNTAKSRWYAIIPCSLAIVYLITSLFVPALSVGQLQAALGLDPQFGSCISGKNISESVTVFQLGVLYYHKMVHFLQGYGLTLIPQALIRSAYDLCNMNVVKAVGMLLITTFVITGWVATFKKYRLMNIYTFLFMVLLFLYGPLYVRLVVPIIPFLFLYLYSGCEAILRLTIRKKRVGIVVVCILWAGVIFDNALRTCTDPRRTMYPTFGDSQYQKCIAWIVKNAVSNEVIVSQIHSYLFIRRGPYCIPFTNTKTANEFMSYLDAFDVKYIIISQFSVQAGETYIKSAESAATIYLKNFKQVFGDNRSSAYILEYVPD